MMTCPLAWAIAVTRLVLPTPGDPSMSRGLPNCIPRSNLKAFLQGPGADSEYVCSGWQPCGPEIYVKIYIYKKYFFKSVLQQFLLDLGEYYARKNKERDLFTLF